MSRLMSLRSRPNDLPTSSSKISRARTNCRVSGGAAVSVPPVRVLLEVVGAQPDEGGLEAGVEDVGAGKQPHLPLFGLRRRLEGELAVADQDQRGHPLGGVGDEHVAHGQAQFEVDRRDDEVARGVVPLAIEPEAMQRIHLRQPILGHNPPRRVGLAGHGRRAGRPADVEPPGGELAARAALDEHLDDEAVAVAGEGAVERHPVAFAHHRPGHAPGQGGVEELTGQVGVGVGRYERHPGGAVARRQRRLDPLQHTEHLQLFRIRCLGRRLGRGLDRPRDEQGCQDCTHGDV